MKDIIEKINQEKLGNQPYINLIQKTHPILDIESDIYDENAKPGMFWISNLEENLFSESLTFILVDYQRMLKVILKEATNSTEEESTMIADTGESWWNNEIRSFCIKNSMGGSNRVQSVVYVKVLCFIDNVFIPCMLKVNPGSGKNFNNFLSALQKDPNRSVPTYHKLFTLSSQYIKEAKHPYYSLAFDSIYTVLDRPRFDEINQIITSMSKISEVEDQQKDILIEEF